MKIVENELTVGQFISLFESVGWDAPSPEQVEIALQNSISTFLAVEDGKPVGMVRLLGDHAMSYYIKDFAVSPHMQGKGVGRVLMEHLENYIRQELKEGWAVSLELISSKGKETFYKKFGFEVRPCEWDGAGMFKMIRM